MDSSLVDALAHTGLNSRQAATYVALLELGQAPASKIAEKTLINRSVTYQVLEELIKAGYVREQAQTKVRQFVALDPQGIFESARAHFENLRFLLPLLRTLHTSKSLMSPMQLFEGKQAVARLFQAHDDADQRMFISCFSEMEKHFPEEMKRWMRRTQQLKQPTPTKLLLTDDKVGRAYARNLKTIPKQEFRFFPTGKEFRMDISIIRETVMIVSFEPICAVVIRSQPIANSARILFALLWDQAKRFR